VNALSDESKIQLLQRFKRGELPKIIPREVQRIENAVAKTESNTQFAYNPDGSLSNMKFSDGDKSYQLFFTWNFDGSLSEITKTDA
jgi:hypothetical protein